MGRLSILASALALFAVLVVGCGDDGVQPPPPAPTLTSVAPAEGTSLGGTQITLTGTNFVAGTIVRLGGAQASNVSVVSATTITCATPAGTPGDVDVTVTHSGGTATLTNGFTYYPLPTLTNVAPGGGSSFGGTELTLTGTGFTGNDAGTNTVTVGGVDCTDLVTVDDSEITCTSPAGTAGAVDVVVSNDNGAATAAGGYTYWSTILAADGGGNPPGVGVHYLYAIDAVTGAIETVGPIGFAVTAMDFHPTTGVLYGTTATRTGCCPPSGRELITIDPVTGAGTLIGLTNDAGAVNHQVPGASFVGDVLYGTDGPFGNLITIDLTSGLVTPVPPIGGQPLSPGGGFAADAASANVYYMTGNASPIWIVNPAGGVFTAGPVLVPSGNPNLALMNSATFHNGTLYAIESSGGIGDRQLVTVDVNTGVLTPVGAVYTPSLINALASPTR